MNKNTKKFVVALLSVMMVLSFMPTMAFAAAGDATPHAWKVDETKSKAATCAEGGYNVSYCTVEGCTVTKAEITAKLDHELQTSGVQYTVDEYLDAIIAEGASADELKRVATALQNMCYTYAKSCTKCGKLQKNNNGQYVFENNGNYGHTRPDGVADCAEKFTCAFCHKEVTVPVNKNNHELSNWKTVAEHVCPLSTNPNTIDGVNKQERTCEDCGKKETRVVTAVAYNGRLAGTVLSDQDWRFKDAYRDAHTSEHNITPLNPQPTTDEEKAVSVLYDGKYYAPNDTFTAPTCTRQGMERLVCADCGLQLGDWVRRTLDHEWTTKTAAATCTERGYTQKICSNCTAVGTTTYGADPLGHNYEKNDVMPANCEFPGLTIISCTRCKEQEITRTSTHIVPVDKDMYFTGFRGELLEGAPHAAPYSKCIKVDDWHELGHKWGAYVDYTPATCEDPAVQARKCSNCGSFNHTVAMKTVGDPIGHDIKSYTVAPTCGEEGYSYDTCDICKLYINHETKKKNNRDPDDDRTNFINRYDIKPPVKAAGTPCEFEWGDLDENTEAEICKNCGAVKPGTETPKTEEKKAKEAADAAKPVISAAADITNDTANYKASSIKAIEEAKKNLDTAIYAGNSDQIRQATAELQAAIDAAAKKDANTMKAKGKTVKANAKKKTTFSKAKAFKISGAKGAVTFKKKSGNKKVTVSKAGKVTVKKGFKKGKTYKIKVTVKAAGNGDYLAKSQVVTLKVKVK